MAKKPDTKKVTKAGKKPAKSKDNKSTQFVKLEHDLLTSVYTTIVYKDTLDIVPNTFKVIKTEPELYGKHKGHNLVLADVHFQEGPIKELGVNGISNEDTIGMVLSRLEGFQASEYKCRENAVAITKLEEALMWLRRRTNKRVSRGVVGTSKV